MEGYQARELGSHFHRGYVFEGMQTLRLDADGLTDIPEFLNEIPRLSLLSQRGNLHSNTNASLTAFLRSCSEPRYLSVVRIDSCPSRN